MTDREMLELAARAAGIEVWFPRMSDGKGGAVEPCHTLVNGQTQVWNPFADDGDALRLARKLSFTVNIWNMARKTFAGDGESGIGWTEPHGVNADAATRRAIVRAAAEVGKQMEVTK